MILKRARYVIILIALFGLYLSIPGFRTGELKSYFGLFMQPKGLGIWAWLGLGLLSIPGAVWIREKGGLRLLISAVIIEWAVLFYVQFLVEYLAGPKAGLWGVRLLLLGFFAFSVQKVSCSRNLFKGAPWHRLFAQNRFDAILIGLLIIFSLREQAHLLFSRSAQPFGDEIYFWYRASIDALNGGVSAVIARHTYVPGLPWLASLAPRFFGIHQSEALWGYPCFIFFAFLATIFELARGSRLALLGGLATLFLSFKLSRDMHFLMFMSLYGEGLAALLSALVLVEATYKVRAEELSSSQKWWLPTAFLAGFASVSKPPISSLIVPLWILGLLAWSFKFRKKIRRLEHFVWICVAVVFSLLPQNLWKFMLSLEGRSPEYSISPADYVKLIPSFDVPIGILLGLRHWGSPQFSYALPLLLVLGLMWLLRSKSLWFWRGAWIQLLINWGFVLGLYATLWKNVETGSAGRYLAHGAFAIILTWPLTIALYEQRNRE